MVMVNRLTPSQEEDLVRLYQGEWWTRARRLPDVHRMLAGSDVVVALVDGESGRLAGFVRGVTDGVFKAVLFDMIVAAPFRGRGLGRRLMEAVLEHPSVRGVRHVELYCRGEVARFYRRWGFRDDPDGVHLMRREGEGRNAQEGGSP